MKAALTGGSGGFQGPYLRPGQPAVEQITSAILVADQKTDYEAGHGKVLASAEQ
jgi:hypothetical protein